MMRHNKVIISIGFVILAVLSCTVFLSSASFADPKKKTAETVAQNSRPAEEQTETQGKTASEDATGEQQGLAAADYDENDFMPKTTEGSYAWDIIKLLIILGLMVGGFYYFFKFVTKRTGLQVGGEDVINTIAVMPVGQNKNIQIIEIAGKVLVLGVADGGINLITEITNKDEIERMRIVASRTKPAPDGGFQEYIRNKINAGVGKAIDRVNRRRGRASFTDSGEWKNKEDYLRKQNGRLKDLYRHDDDE